MKGFILTRQWRDTKNGVQLILWLATDHGPAQLIIPQQSVVCFFRVADLSYIQNIIAEFPSASYKSIELKNIAGEPVMALYSPQRSQLNDIVSQLRREGVSVWEDDIKPVERFLMERFITTSLYVDQSVLPEEKQSSFTINTTRVKTCDYQPSLKVVSLDIETSMDAKALYSIAVYSEQYSYVFMVDESVSSMTEEQFDGNGRMMICPSAKVCLREFIAWFNQNDPDIIIGWHVVQFDLWVMQQLCQYWQIPFAIGRAGQTPHWRDDSQNESRHYVHIPGRVVLDGIELLSTAFYRFERYTLQFVANELLGEGKLLRQDDRGDAITDLFLNNKPALAAYNLQDCQLVWDIFEHAKLLDFAIARSHLTGLALDRMGGSVASFEYAYLPRLHRANYVAPNLGELQSHISSPGGYVMRSKPGLYEHVLVLDFKSLYPSIIRTFNIDPYAFWVAEHNSLADDEVIPGFNGARFSREHPILPGIIDELWQARDQAKVSDNQPLSYAIKIIMNSFYGVLGSTGCRFFDPRVCSSITLRGHDIIQKSRDWILQKGYDVIYGDTDSLFIWLGKDADGKQADSVGQTLAQGLNQWWQDTLEKEMAIKSRLEIEFETHYRHFLMPTIRGSSEGSKKRYAGIVQSQSGDDVKEELVFKGLETVRTDWTELAKIFQKTLYYKVFKQEPYKQYVCQVVNDLLSGQLDQQLVYKKKLRRPLAAYQKSTPPHVKAARHYSEVSGELLGKGDGIDYLITTNGPEPIVYQQSKIDYQHYIDKQLKPIADSVFVFLNDRFDEIIDQQMPLL